MISIPLRRNCSLSIAMAFLVLLAVMAATGGAAAQILPSSNPPPTKRFSTNGVSYYTFAEAEAAMRAIAPSGTLLKRKNVFVGPGATSVTITTRFGYDDATAEHKYPEGYTIGGWTADNPAGFCTAVGVAQYPNYCADEAQARANMLWRLQASQPTCTYSNPRDDGAYATPYTSANVPYNSNQGTLTFNSQKFLRVDVICPGWTSAQTNSYQYGKQQAYRCPLGFTAIQSPQPSVNGWNLCRNSDTYDIVEVNATPVASCPVGHPCHPATGDKSRSEQDFVFAGRPFVRYYHSRFALSKNRRIGEHWTHTYTDRLEYAYPYPLYSEQGAIENFTAASSDWYRGESGRVIRKYVDGTADLMEPNGDIKRFDTQGVLISIRNPGRPLDDVTMIYDPATSGGDRRLIAVTDATGRSVQFQYTNDRMTSVNLPDGKTVAYSYDSNGNFASVNYGSGQVKTYVYAESGSAPSGEKSALTGIVSETGNRYGNFKYDAYDRVVYSGLNGGAADVEVTQVSYPSGSSAAALLANGNLRTYQFDSSLYRRPLSVVDNSGTSSSTYDAYGRRTQSVSVAGVTTNDTYANLYRASTTLAAGTSVQKTIEYVNETNFNKIAERRELDAASVVRAKTTWAYNSRGQTLTESRIDPATLTARTTTIDYCEQTDVTAGTCPLVGLVKSVDGPRTGVADTATYEYRMADDAVCATSPLSCAYRKGDLWKVTNALGQVVEILRYDGARRVLASKDANGVLTEMQYDHRGNLVASKVRGTDDASEADDRITSIEYWPNGLVKKVVQPDGSYTTYVYDNAYRLTGIGDAYGNTIAYTLDNAGQQTAEQVKDPQGTLMRSLSRTYDSLGRLQTQADAYSRVTSFTYQIDGELDKTTDALARVTDNNSDALGRLTRTLQDMNGIAAETKFSYDALDNLTQVNDPKGLNTNYTYNGLGDLTQLQSPDTGTTTYTYDSAGNRASQTDARGVTSTYGYDALNRLTSVAYPTSSLNIGYVYDTTQAACASGETFSTGRLTRINDGSGSTVYCYNRFGDLVRKVQTTNGQNFTLRYVRDVAGRITSVVYPDGAVADYVYDAAGRVSEIGATPSGGLRQVLLTGVQYYPYGPASQWSYGNGRLMKRSLNQNYQPGFVEVVASDGLSLGYEFDEVGNLKKLRGAAQADPPTRVYGYDGLNRLTEAKDGATNVVQQAYAYDKTGNRTSATVSGATTSYSYGTGDHRLASVGTTARSYDSAGNTTQIGGTAREFVYNDLNRIGQYKQAGTTLMNYAYNGRGEQVRRYATGGDTYSMYDEAGHWIGDYASGGAPSQQVVWFGDLPVGVLAGAGASQKLHYIEPDALGTPRQVVDPTRGTSGIVVWKWDLSGEAFGTTAPNQDPDGDSTAFVFDMRFPGQRYDSVSGVNYNYFRDYEAATGRYVESDPIGLRGGISTYGYVNASPLLKIDPKGLECGPKPCDGVWRQAGSINPNLDFLGLVGSLIGTNICKCTWLCYPRGGIGIHWSGDPTDPSLIRTTGVPTYEGGDVTIERNGSHGHGVSPQGCLCKKPSADDETKSN